MTQQRTDRPSAIGPSRAEGTDYARRPLEDTDMHTEAKSGRDKSTRSPMGRVRRWVKRGLQVSVMVILALAIAGAIYQATATEIDQRQLGGAPGEMVSVGDHKLHINCTGTGSPTVILESGAPGTSVEWSAWVQPEVAEVARVCAYDRAGLGWSEAGPGPRDSRRVTGELHTLLQNAGIEGPYIMVGHSAGEHHVRVYADRYPDEVAGMVLVDAAHPDQFERIPGMESGMSMIRGMSVVGPFLTATGIVRLSGMFAPEGSVLPALQRGRSENLINQTPFLLAAFEEYDALPAAIEQVRDTGTLGDKPLAVVSAADHGADMMADSRAEAVRVEQAAQALQEELTDLSSNSTRRVVAGSDHTSVVLNRYHARVTSEEILKVVEAARTGQALTR